MCSGGSRPVLIGGPGWGRLFCKGAHTTPKKGQIPHSDKAVFTVSAILIG